MPHKTPPTKASSPKAPLKQRMLVRFAAAVTERPAWGLALTFALGGVALLAVSQLRFESSYLALLPQEAPEVKAIEEVRHYAGGTSELVVAVGGPKARRLSYARRVVSRLNASRWVAWSEVDLPTAFFHRHRLYFADADDLDRARAILDETIAQAISEAKRKANPLLIDLDDDDDDRATGASPSAASSSSTLATFRREFAAKGATMPRTRTTSDGKYLLISVKPHASISELGEGKRVLAGIRGVLASARVSGDERLDVRLAGSLVTNQAQNRRMSADLSAASLLALILAVGLITLVSRRLSAVLVISFPLILGVIVTLAVAALTIGHLNLVSGFLVAALVGLGVDFGIHLYLRYLDELVATPGDARRAMRSAIVATFGSSLTAALTTSVAFLALLAADFRGFSEYGMIAAIGVLLTLVITFVALPPVALLIARLAPPRPDDHTRRRLRNTRQLSRPLAWLMVAAGLAFVSFSGAKLHDLSFYNNFKHLQGVSPEISFDDYITREMGGSLSPALLMVDDLDSARRVEALLRHRMAVAGAASPIGRVASIASLLPQELGRRQQLLADLHEKLTWVLDNGAKLSSGDRVTLRDLREATLVPAWGLDEVPLSFRKRLIAKAGGKHFVLVWPRRGLDDDRRIAAWASALRGTMADLHEADIHALVLDENLIAARVVELIRADGPRVLSLAAVAVLLLLILDFRRFDKVILVAGSLVVGVTAMLGAMVLFDMHLNLFNAVVLPTVLGIGIDNAVHLVHAYEARGRGSVPWVVATSGRAALLSSATTAIGFGASIIAHHLGIRQLGLLALVGVGTTFVASTIMLPALLRLLESEGETASDSSAKPIVVPVTATLHPSGALSGMQRSTASSRL